MSKPILITGATGKQGGAVVNALLASPDAKSFELLAVTRNPESASAKKLEERGVKLVKGNLNDVSSIFTEAAKATSTPIWGVFSVQDPMGGKGGLSEEEQGKALVDAALEHGVKMFVYTSVERGGEKSFDNPTPVAHFISKHNIEHHLVEKAGAKGEKMQWTILRPTAFLDNFTPSFFGKAFATMFKVSLKTGAEAKPLQLIAVSDIGVFAAKAFEKPEEYNSKALSLAGADITFEQAEKIFKEKTGADIPMTYEFLVKGILWGVSEVGTMFNWFYTDGYGANISELKKIHPGLLDLGDWIESSGHFEVKK